MGRSRRSRLAAGRIDRRWATRSRSSGRLPDHGRSAPVRAGGHSGRDSRKPFRAPTRAPTDLALAPRLLPRRRLPRRAEPGDVRGARAAIPPPGASSELIAAAVRRCELARAAGVVAARRVGAVGRLAHGRRLHRGRAHQARCRTGSSAATRRRSAPFIDGLHRGRRAHPAWPPERLDHEREPGAARAGPRPGDLRRSEPDEDLASTGASRSCRSAREEKEYRTYFLYFSDETLDAPVHFVPVADIEYAGELGDVRHRGRGDRELHRQRRLRPQQPPDHEVPGDLPARPGRHGRGDQRRLRRPRPAPGHRGEGHPPGARHAQPDRVEVGEQGRRPGHLPGDAPGRPRGHRAWWPASAATRSCSTTRAARHVPVHRRPGGRHDDDPRGHRREDQPRTRSST